jgi:hypothetical protein
MEARPPASLSLDLDDKWSYLKTHGDAGWESLPSYLGLVVPRVLEFLAQRGLTVTVFVVGQDAALERNRDLLAGLAAAGHEIGNHSYRHEPWLHLYGESELEHEIASAEQAIERATGRRPRGFRGPGYSLCEAALRVLLRRGYLYDASTLPTFLGPLARAYYFFSSRFSGAERRRRGALFGRLSDGLRPLKPYFWNLAGERLLELPVTTLPFVRLPIHASYVLYLSRYSRALALAYFRNALRLCRAAGAQPSLLLHPLDFLGCEDDSQLSFFPAMDLPAAAKLALVGECLGALARHFEVMTLERHAALLTRRTLPVRQPRFAAAAP